MSSEQQDTLGTNTQTLPPISKESIEYPPSDSSSQQPLPRNSQREYYAGKGQGLVMIYDRLHSMLDRELRDANHNTIDPLTTDGFIHLNKHACDLTVQAIQQINEKSNIGLLLWLRNKFPYITPSTKPDTRAEQLEAILATGAWNK